MQENQLNLKLFFKNQKKLEKQAQIAILDYTHRSIVNKMNGKQRKNTSQILFAR